MKDKRLEKIKKHYFIQIDNQRLKILNHKIDFGKNLFIINTKVMGQCFPHGKNIQVLIADEAIQPLTIGFKTMYKDDKIETWEYTILG